MIYDSLIDYCDEAYITWVDINVPNGNKMFPIVKLLTTFEVETDADWQLSKTGMKYRIVKYRKK
jgi:dihydrofolate reductase